MEQYINAAFQELRQCLKPIYPGAEADIIADRVIEQVSGLSRTDRILHPGKTLNKSQSIRLNAITIQLLKQRPVQYVLGFSEFYGLQLKVNEQALIPRPETEELVEWCLAETGEMKNRPLSVLDIGTGSGCIALALKYHLAGAAIFAMDISDKALDLAKENARRLDLDISFLRWDILSENEIDFLPSLDIIISNPPYITPAEQSHMSPHVLQYEPHLALFVSDNDPLQFYKKINRIALRLLGPKGKLFFELHEDFAPETADYYRQNAWEVTLKNDMQGKTRMMMAQRLSAE